MQATDVLMDALERVRQRVGATVDGLDREALAWRPDPGANSIAWLVWHLTRVQDDHMSEIAGHGQAWVLEGWAERFSLPTDYSDTGYGHSPQQVAAITPEGPELREYHEQVAEQTQRYLRHVDTADFQRIIDRSYDPPVTVGVRVVSVIGDTLQHVGQAAYVRGLFERRARG